MSKKENPIEVKYPMRDQNQQSEWTAEYRKEWNRKYRQQVKEGKRQPTPRSQDSKWKDQQFRKAYDQARLKKITEDKKEKKMSLETVGESRPNYTQQEKAEILKKLLDMVREGKEPAHPYFELVLAVKKEFKRSYPSRQKK
jgi:hypothetical protein